jgi:hypothetical protein
MAVCRNLFLRNKLIDMKAIYVFVFGAMLLLIVMSTGLFATTRNCSTVACCGNAPKKNGAVKKVPADISTFETNPFNILTPGNHF